MTERHEIESCLLEYLRDRTAGRIPAEAIQVDTPPAGGGVLDSLGFVELLAFVQSRFSITFGPEDYRPDRIGTVAACAGCIEKKSVTA